MTTHYRDPRDVYGSDEWAEDNLRFTRNTLRSAEGDIRILAVNLPFYRQWCERHGVAWETFCKDTLAADPRAIAALEEADRVRVAHVPVRER